jgi:rhodanese-related sulfurtransferase
VALALRKLGVTRVRPLAGGLEAWRERGYPMTALDVPVSDQG